VLAVLAIGLPLALLIQPLIAENGSKSASLRFERDMETFGRAEAEIVGRQTAILTFPPNARVNRLEIAQRLRQEVLEPWRAASRPLLRATTLSPEEARSARMQEAVRDYVRARESAVELRALAFESGDPADEARATLAEKQLGKTLDVVNQLSNART
jgi:hypothetical protein